MATAAILTVLSSELPLSYAQTNQDLERKILYMHNSERAAVRVAPLTWSIHRNSNLLHDHGFSFDLISFTNSSVFIGFLINQSTFNSR